MGNLSLFTLLRLVQDAFFAGLFDQFKIQFSLDDLEHSDIACTETGHIFEHRTATWAATDTGELANAPGNQVNQNVGVTNLLQSFFANIAIQLILSFKPKD